VRYLILILRLNVIVLFCSSASTLFAKEHKRDRPWSNDRRKDNDSTCLVQNFTNFSVNKYYLLLENSIARDW
jgi:hypothetical protein